jgi:acyl-CoA thioester hydrolase
VSWQHPLAYPLFPGLTECSRRSDNDVYHHLNNSVYAFLIDSVVNAYLIERCGLKPATSEQIGLVVSSYCDFFGSVAYPSVVELGLRVLKLGKSSVLYEVGIFEQGQDAVRAVGGFIHVFVQQDGRRPAKDGMDTNIRDGLQQIMTKETAKL